MKIKRRNSCKSLSIEKLLGFFIKKPAKKVSSLRNKFLNRETCFKG
jgi:hypothetical protein